MTDPQHNIIPGVRYAPDENITAAEYERRVAWREARVAQDDPQHLADENAKVDEAFSGPSVTVFEVANSADLIEVFQRLFNMDAPTVDTKEVTCSTEPYLTMEDLLTIIDTCMILGATLVGQDVLGRRALARQINLHNGTAQLDAHLQDMCARLRSLAGDMLAGKTTGLHRAAF